MQDDIKPLRPQMVGALEVPEADPEGQHYAEECRLAHVAATRPRHRHFISYCRVGRIKGEAWRFPCSPILTKVLEQLKASPVIEFEMAPGTDAEARLTAEAEANEERRQMLMGGYAF